MSAEVNEGAAPPPSVDVSSSSSSTSGAKSDAKKLVPNAASVGANRTASASTLPSATAAGDTFAANVDAYLAGRATAGGPPLPTAKVGGPPPQKGFGRGLSAKQKVETIGLLRDIQNNLAAFGNVLNRGTSSHADYGDSIATRLDEIGKISEFRVTEAKMMIDEVLARCVKSAMQDKYHVVYVDGASLEDAETCKQQNSASSDGDNESLLEIL